MMKEKNDFLGTFLKPEEEIYALVPKLEGLILDWDGVFTNAHKNIKNETTYSEIDVFMLNMFRLYYYVCFKKQLPVAIITGSQNPTAVHFAKKLHINAIYYRAVHKLPALEHFSKMIGIAPNKFAFIFDDIVDLSISKLCGVRLTVNHTSKFFFLKFLREHRLTDYISKASSGDSALREIFEMLLHSTGHFEEIINERASFGERYRRFIAGYRQIATKVFTLDADNKSIVDG